MSKYSDFKEWSKTQAPNKSALFASTVDQDDSWAEMNADMNAGVATPQIVSDATVAIAYADHCTQSLQAEIEKLKTENERLKAAQCGTPCNHKFHPMNDKGELSCVYCRETIWEQQK